MLSLKQPLIFRSALTFKLLLQHCEIPSVLNRSSSAPVKLFFFFKFSACKHDLFYLEVSAFPTV